MFDIVLITRSTSPAVMTSSTVGPSSPIFATSRGENPAGCSEGFAHRGREGAIDSDRLAGRLHLRPEVRVDGGQLVHREDRRLDRDEVPRRNQARAPSK